MNSIVIDKNNTDGEDIDRSKGFLPYTFTFLSVVITILFFIDSNLIMGILFLLNVFSDIKNKA